MPFSPPSFSSLSYTEMHRGCSSPKSRHGAPVSGVPSASAPLIRHPSVHRTSSADGSSVRALRGPCRPMSYDIPTAVACVARRVQSCSQASTSTSPQPIYAHLPRDPALTTRRITEPSPRVRFLGCDRHHLGADSLNSYYQTSILHPHGNPYCRPEISSLAPLPVSPASILQPLAQARVACPVPDDAASGPSI